jgi:hypothetical protein
MFAILHSDINSLKSGLLHLTNQHVCKKSRSAKVKDGIINLILRNYQVDQYNTIMTLEYGGLVGVYWNKNHQTLKKGFLQYANIQKVQKWQIQFCNSHEKLD